MLQADDAILTADQAPPRRRWAVVLLVILGLVLGALVVRHTWAGTFSTTAPELALRLNPNHPSALIALAEQRLAVALAEARKRTVGRDQTRLGAFSQPGLVGLPDPAASTSDTLPEGFRLAEETAHDLRALLQRSIEASPLNSRAWSILGRIGELTGDEDATREAYTRAVRLSRQETSAAVWLLNDRWRVADIDAFISYAEILMRTRPSLIGPITPMLARIADGPKTRPKILAALTQDPPWRSSFLQGAPRHVTDARTPMWLLLGMKTAGHAPTTSEVRSYLEFLLSRGLASMAQTAFVQLLSDAELAEVGRLNNASFEKDPSGLPFDWSLRPGAYASAEIIRHPRDPGRRVLSVSFQGGRAQFSRGVSQWLVLQAGRYRFSYRVEGELRGRRGLRWRIACQGPKGGARLAESEMLLGRFGDGRTLTLDFVVPERDCPSQIMQLDLDARSSSEQLVLGELIFDDLGLSRFASREAPPE